MYWLSLQLFLYREGFSDSYMSTGTLNKILQEEHNGEGVDGDDTYDVEGDVIMDGSSSVQQDGAKNGHANKNGPRLNEVLEDDDFIPELRQKNELLLK